MRSRLSGRPDFGVTDDQDVRVATEGDGRVADALTLGNGGALGLVYRDDLSAQPLHCGHERARRARRRLVEHVGEELSLEEVGPPHTLDDALHLAGDAEDVVEIPSRELLDGKYVAATPSR